MKTGLEEALQLGLLSYDPTIRSNVAVGMPIDVAVVRRDALALELNYRIEPDDPLLRRSVASLVGELGESGGRHPHAALRSRRAHKARTEKLKHGAMGCDDRGVVSVPKRL